MNEVEKYVVWCRSNKLDPKNGKYVNLYMACFNKSAKKK